LIRPITLDISADFSSPKWSPGFWCMPTSGTSVPETAIHKDGKLSPPEEYVGFARQIDFVERPTS